MEIAATTPRNDRVDNFPSFPDHDLVSKRHREAIGACIDNRRDKAPLPTNAWPALFEQSAVAWTGFTMTTAELQYRVGATRLPRQGLLGRQPRIYWVVAGDVSAEFPTTPLSCHESLALAAEMLMAIYADTCAL
jgi:hypothetical protein